MSSLPGGASMTMSVSAFGAQAAGSTSPRDTRKYRRKLASADATLMRPMRQPKSRVSQEPMSARRGSFLSIRISIVRNTVPATSIKAAFFAAGLLLHAAGVVRADDADCPPPAGATDASTPVVLAPETDPANEPITIESDSGGCEFDVNGNARLCGNVEMRQGNRRIKADCLEYDATTQRAKLDGAVEFSDPTLTVRGSSGTYSPSLGAQFEGTQFELPARNARGAARSMKVDADGTITLKDVSIVYLPWISFPIGPQRKSGFLFPNVGASSRNGLQLELPYYWNIRPN